MQPVKTAGVLLCVAASVWAAAADQSHITIRNNQPFSIRQPLEIRGAAEKDTWVMTDVAAGATAAAQSISSSLLNLEPSGNAVVLKMADNKLGKLSWSIMLFDQKPGSPDMTPEGLKTATPLPLRFSNYGSSVQGDAETSGLKFSVELVSRAEFIDISSSVTNLTAEPTNKYCAVICHFETTSGRVQERTVCYDNRISKLPENGATPYRKTDLPSTSDIRHLYAQRGVDWLNSKFDNVSLLWMNDFAESFAAAKKVGKTKPRIRWVNANQGHLAQEAIARGNTLDMVTEIARSNHRTFRDRTIENVLPEQGKSIGFTQRLMLSKEPVSPERADQVFVGYTCYYEEKKTSSGIEITYGVPRVQMGTNYFPYSTLGENFDYLKLPGMDREGFWPLAADTVEKWELFRDDIKRDLRIAKAMGFDLIRLHHLELIQPLHVHTRHPYMEFLMGQMRELGFKVLIDAILPPEDIANLVGKYRDLIAGIEIENEVLIWGIDDGKVQEWNKMYDAVKAIAPEIPVHLTSHVNMGIFNKLEELGGKTDKIGFHTYQDDVDAIPSSRGWALALGNYAAKVGKPAIITEWNWRKLAWIPEDQRAILYKDIFGNAFVTRSVPTFYQFQFNETLCPNPRTGRGNVLRHYELIHLSRRPKEDALVLMDLIRQYGTVPEVTTTRTVVELDESGKGTGTLHFDGKEGNQLSLVAETAQGSTVSLSQSKISGDQTDVSFQFTGGKEPGFYHAFVRVQDKAEKLVSYAWIEGRKAGAPKLDVDTPTTVAYSGGIKKVLENFGAGAQVVVFGKDASVLEAETAIMIAETLESATGRPVPYLREDFVDGRVPNGAVKIVVGTTETCTLLSALGNKAVVGIARIDPNIITVMGATKEATEWAGIDLTLRWWRNAKDSAARKVGLVQKELKLKGIDPTALP